MLHGTGGFYFLSERRRGADFIALKKFHLLIGKV
jgi:hypothetical protein